jgi:hypothetical protein
MYNVLSADVTVRSATTMEIFPPVIHMKTCIVWNVPVVDTKRRNTSMVVMDHLQTGKQPARTVAVRDRPDQNIVLP